ncbi:MAG: ribosome biogenesis GTPase Der, partial [Deltaproteobacteria bacterium]|nr:ribosome biogenesis GTPase Der [Deltaproteobacteria bacterium]
LIGRPNVGKSTLFNRLLRQNKSLTHDLPGVTRDLIYGEVRGDRDFALVDTGGLVLDDLGATPGRSDDFMDEIFAQAREAIASAAVILLVVDGREGLTPLDEALASFLRQSNKDILLVVNKVDGAEQADMRLADFYALGLPSCPASAAHGFGTTELLERLGDMLPADTDTEDDKSPHGLRIAVLGRPNVGKSSVVNALLGKDRLIVSDLAGTTRDSVDVQLERDGKIYTFVDTAGLRRRTKIDDVLERFSTIRSIQAAKQADVVVLMIDALTGVVAQDKKLLSFLDRSGTAFVVAVNKVDLVPRAAVQTLRKNLEDELRFCAHVPVVLTSSVTRAGLGGLLPLLENLNAQCGLRIGTGQLNRLLQDSLTRHQPPVVKRRRAKFYYLTQPSTHPPTFVFFVNDPALIKTEYARFLERQIRKSFRLTMAPIRMAFRSSHDK